MKPTLAISLALFAFLVGYCVAPSSEESEEAETTAKETRCDDENPSKITKNYDSLRLRYAELQDANSELKKQLEGLESCPDAVTTQRPEEIAKEEETPEHEEKEEPVKSEDDLPEGELDYTEVRTKYNIEKEVNNYKPSSKKGGFLKRMTLREPQRTIEDLPEIKDNDRYLEKLTGIFRGSIKYLYKKRGKGNAKLELREYNPEKPNQWAVRIEVRDSKKKLSIKKGGRDMLRTIGPKSRAYFIRSSETSYLQLYYQTSKNVLFGNYYEKQRDKQYKRVATVYMKKKIQD